MESFVLIAVVVIVFFLLRELWTWYWKLNKIVSNQDKVNALLNKILIELEKQNTKERTTKEPSEGRLQIRNENTGEIKKVTLDEFKDISGAEDIWEIID